MNDNIQFDSFIDIHGFPGVNGVLPPEPIGYRVTKAFSITPNLTLLLNGWLVDGHSVSSPLDAHSPAQVSNTALQLYLCCAIYPMNRKTISGVTFYPSKALKHDGQLA